MTNQIKKLNLTSCYLGGSPFIYDEALATNNSFNQICYIYGDYPITKDSHNEYYLEMCGSYLAPEYLEQAKAYVKSLNPDAVFANDQKDSAFISPKEVIEKIGDSLMKYEKNIILKHLGHYHRIYIGLVKSNLANRYCTDYDTYYPTIQVHEGLYQILKEKQNAAQAV
jgi:hypothetical protein